MLLLCLAVVAAWTLGVVQAATPLMTSQSPRVRRTLLTLWRTSGAHGWAALSVAAPQLVRPALRVYKVLRLLPWVLSFCLAGLLSRLM